MSGQHHRGRQSGKNFASNRNGGCSVNRSQNIPFLDLVTPHVELEQELTAVFQQVNPVGRFYRRPMVENFEQEFAVFCRRSTRLQSTAEQMLSVSR